MFPFKWQIVYGKLKNNKEFNPDVVIRNRWFCQRTVIKYASMMGINRNSRTEFLSWDYE
jgi:hypothetical protein